MWKKLRLCNYARHPGILRHFHDVMFFHELFAINTIKGGHKPSPTSQRWKTNKQTKVRYTLSFPQQPYWLKKTRHPFQLNRWTIGSFRIFVCFCFVLFFVCLFVCLFFVSAKQLSCNIPMPLQHALMIFCVWDVIMVICAVRANQSWEVIRPPYITDRVEWWTLGLLQSLHRDQNETWVVDRVVTSTYQLGLILERIVEMMLYRYSNQP